MTNACRHPPTIAVVLSTRLLASHSFPNQECTTMKSMSLCRRAAALLLPLVCFVSLTNAGDRLPAYAKAPKPPIEQTGGADPMVGIGFTVQDLFGGQIFGYDVDRNGTEGLLSEALAQRAGSYLIATETFDQATGRITALVEVQIATQDDFVTLGVFGNHVGLRERERVQGLRVVQRIYNVMNPLSGHRFNGTWTPPIDDHSQFLEDVEGNQGTSRSGCDGVALRLLWTICV